RRAAVNVDRDRVAAVDRRLREIARHRVLPDKSPSRAGDSVPRAPGSSGAPAVAVGSLGKNTGRVSPPPRGRMRNEAYRLRTGLRAAARERAQKCGHTRIASAVEIRLYKGLATFSGLMRCGLVWECPVCALAIKTGRADEVQRAIEWHGADRAYLLTLTVRHGVGDDLKAVRQGVAKAWRRVQSGAPWKRLKADMGFVGSIRALEVTHGAHGWHPHLHVVLLTRELAPAVLESYRARISIRWQHAVESVLGRAHAPLDKAGCDLRGCHNAEYLTKLGLELTAPAEKRARGGNRSVNEIAADFVATQSETDKRLYQRYCTGIYGARMLTWTKGLRRAAGLLEERSDEEILEDFDTESVVVATLTGAC